jgi:hypothetical protein
MAKGDVMHDYHIYMLQYFAEKYEQITASRTPCQDVDSELYNRILTYFDNNIEQLDNILSKNHDAQYQQRWKEGERRVEMILNRCRKNVDDLWSMSELKTPQNCAVSTAALSEAVLLKANKKPENASQRSSTNIFKSLYQFVTQTKNSKAVYAVDESTDRDTSPRDLSS